MLLSDHNLHDLSFKASNGWLHRFLSMNGIRRTMPHGDAGAVDKARVEESMLKLCTPLGTYEPEQIYNQDESGFVYQMLPNVFYLAPE